MVQKSSKFPAKWAGVGIVLIILILVAVVWGSYNSLVSLNQNADNAWANVETQYQRRIDLIPNLVSTVRGYAGFEQATLTQITEIRSQWQSQTPEQQVKSANEFESALSKLLLVAENYPDLKASQNYIALMDNLAETENMISVARTRYNDAIRKYNTATKVFPSNIIAGWFGFSERTYFSAKPGAETAPAVNVTI